MKNRILIYPFAIMVLGLILTASCKKTDETASSSSGIIFNPNLTYGTMTDQDGNVYKTITIGTQTWMAENLRTTKYRNGDPIPNVTDNTAWFTLLTDAYCNYKNTGNSDTINTYGRLYNWYAVSDKRNIAPIGWHVPTEAEWTTLTTYLGGESVAGGKMKETGITHWPWTNPSATNESGFTALPSGVRGYNLHGDFGYLGLGLGYWSSTPGYGSSAMDLYMDAAVNANCYSSSRSLWMGFSVRCVMD